MLSRGPLDAKLWVILDSPESEDVSAKLPCVSASGRYFISLLDGLGVKADTIRLEYIIEEVPPKGEFRNYALNKEGSERLNTRVLELKRRIKEFSPNMVLLLGYGSLNSLLNKDNVPTWRGHYLWSSELGVKFLATYKPSVALRQRYVDKDQKPGQYEALMTADVRKAVQGASFHDCQFPKLELKVQPTADEAVSILEDLYENAQYLSYDIETVNHVLVDCIGFSSSLNRGYCIPLWYPDRRSYYDSTAQIKVFELIRRLLQSDIPKIAQNSQFDTVILYEYYDTLVKNIVFDTMLFAHNMFCDLPKDLGTLMSLYTNLPYHKQMIHSNSVVDRWLYNAQDVIATLHVMNGMLKENEEYLHVDKHYYMVTNPAISVLVDMQKTGVAVNLEYLKAAIAHEVEVKEEILAAFDSFMPVKLDTKGSSHKFNPASSDQKQELFYRLLGLKKKYEKGSPTTNKAFLKYVMECHSIPAVRTLAEACYRYSVAHSTASQLSAPLYNGRMHTAYSLGGVAEGGDGEDLGTDTGRLASKRSYFYVRKDAKRWIPAGTNLQNRKKGHQRRILCPDPGEEFCMCDLWAAEAYLVALDAQEETLLSLLSNGVKIHNWLWEKTQEKWPDECKEANYGYKDAKQGVHSMNYDAQPGIIARSSRLPQHVADWQYAFYHGTFPGIKLRMRRIQEQLKATRSVTSFLGRKIYFVQPWGDELLKRAYAWPSQSTIGELAIIAMTKIYYQGKLREPFMFPSLNTHDGLAIRCLPGNRDAVTSRVADAFNVPITKGKYTIRIPIEVSWGQNFNDVEKDTTKLVRYNDDGTWRLM